MSASPYAPGPWILKPETNARRAAIKAGPLIIAEIFGDGMDQRAATARLIAAAPDLLEVCQRIVRLWDEEDAVFIGCVEDARAAIAKATGEESL